MQLFPHQDRGASFLSGSAGTKGLFFGMGTGKTLTALEAFDRSSANQLLVIAPPIAVPMWQAEIKAYLGLDAVWLKSGKQALRHDTDVIVVSYDIARRRHTELYHWVAGDCTAVICDESHALKDISAQRTRAILGSGGIVSKAAYVWCLTGTPITKWNDDLFPFLCRADLDGLKRRCGSAWHERFLMRYTIRQQRQFHPRAKPVQLVVGNRNTDELAEWVYGEGLALRVDLTEVFENMPPLTTNRLPVKLEMTPELREKLRELKKARISDIVERLKKQEPSLATIRREIGEAKVHAAAIEIAERVDSGQAILVGAWHTNVIRALHDTLESRNLRVRTIDGSTPAAQKQVAERQWNDGELDVLICQIAAAGVSLNLQHGGHQIVCVEEDWSPDIMDQFYARLWRYGQQHHVHVDILVSETVIDIALGRIAHEKRREHGKFNRVGAEMTNG